MSLPRPSLRLFHRALGFLLRRSLLAEGIPGQQQCTATLPTAHTGTQQRAADMWPRTGLAADIDDLIFDRGQRSFRTRSSTSRTLLGCAADLSVCVHLSCHANHATGMWIKHKSCCRACLSTRRLRRCEAHLFICTSGLGERCFEIECRKEYIQRLKTEGCYSRWPRDAAPAGSLRDVTVLMLHLQAPARNCCCLWAPDAIRFEGWGLGCWGL